MRVKSYVCDDCGYRGEFTSYKKARDEGWAVSKDYKKCYCPPCAPGHRLGGAKKNDDAALPESGEQLGFENL